MDLFDLTGKVAVVTGGTRGIGLMVARGLLQAGVRVYISSRKPEAGDAAAAELARFGTVVSVPADLSTEAECVRLAAEVGTREDEVHILVNNAGATWGEPLESFPESAWDKVLDLNLKSPFFLTRAVLPMLEQTATQDDPARLHRNTATPAMSSGRPMRPSGDEAAMASPNSRSVYAIIFDSNGPGAIAFTVICRGPSSLARTRVRWCRAALLAEYE